MRGSLLANCTAYVVFPRRACLDITVARRNGTFREHAAAPNQMVIFHLGTTGNYTRRRKIRQAILQTTYNLTATGRVLRLAAFNAGD
jgi:hypothetical protein